MNTRDPWTIALFVSTGLGIAGIGLLTIAWIING
jgi:hypothetical protein